jgi:hypothetical protein
LPASSIGRLTTCPRAVPSIDAKIGKGPAAMRAGSLVHSHSPERPRKVHPPPSSQRSALLRMVQRIRPQLEWQGFPATATQANRLGHWCYAFPAGILRLYGRTIRGLTR